ncbi:hypothetical protein [Edaphobacter sp.]|uniref:hypothetical protein n=1 Tax=Edaphobacter sp. TaxID=1934404 RepID=UPI002DB650D2|nr:hypothetical protein [Edaphobacter sp.]HEU5341937.1 hypothetical protein [Edaphobacter sp.]
MSLSTPTPSFSQPARTNLLLPVLIAFLVLGMLIVLVVRLTPEKTAALSVSHTIVFPTHVEMGSGSIVLGQKQVEDNLYVLTTLRIEDRTRFPIFIKDYTATLTTEDGEPMTTSAIEKDDIPNLLTTFPALKPLVTEPLLRETVIEPGHTAEGMVILHFPITQSAWDHRRTTVLNVDLYNAGDQPVVITRKSEITTPTYTPPPNSIDK